MIETVISTSQVPQPAQPTSILKPKARAPQQSTTDRIKSFNQLVGNAHQDHPLNPFLGRGAHRIVERFSQFHFSKEEAGSEQLKQHMVSHLELEAEAIKQQPDKRFSDGAVDKFVERAKKEITDPKSFRDAGMRNLERLAAATGARITVKSSDGKFATTEIGGKTRASATPSFEITIGENRKHYKYSYGNTDARKSVSAAADEWARAYGTEPSDPSAKKTIRWSPDVTEGERRKSDDVPQVNLQRPEASRATASEVTSETDLLPTGEISREPQAADSPFESTNEHLVKLELGLHTRPKKEVTLPSMDPFVLTDAQRNILRKEGQGSWTAPSSASNNLLQAVTAQLGDSLLLPPAEKAAKAGNLKELARSMGIGIILLKQGGAVERFGVNAPASPMILGETDGQYHLYKKPFVSERVQF